VIHGVSSLVEIVKWIININHRLV